jgi:hypothetical protein
VSSRAARSLRSLTTAPAGQTFYEPWPGTLREFWPTAVILEPLYPDLFEDLPPKLPVRKPRKQYARVRESARIKDVEKNLGPIMYSLEDLPRHKVKLFDNKSFTVIKRCD